MGVIIIRKFLVNWVLSSFCLFIVAQLFSDIHYDGFVSIMIAALVLGAVNALIKPILHLLLLPITILTLGLFSLVINTIIILLTSAIVPGFSVEGFWTAFFASIVLSVLNSIFIKKENKNKNDE